MSKPPNFTNWLGGLVPKSTVTKNIIKSAGEAFSDAKKSQARPQSGAVSPTKDWFSDVPFVGHYDATVEIEFAGPEFANSEFATGTINHSKVQLDCNGHPLILPLDRMHPGFCAGISLMPEYRPGSVFESGIVDISAADSVECQDLVSDWAGIYVSDGSAFRLRFNIRKHHDPNVPNVPVDPTRETILSGYVQCVRTHGG